MENKTENSKLTVSNSKGEFNKNISRIIKGSIFAIIISLLLLFIYANLLTYTNIPEASIVPVVITISGISILIVSSIRSLKIKKQGMINVALVGLIYMIFIYLLSSIVFTGFGIDTNAIIMIVIGTAAGIVGGIIGVNL